VPTDVERLLAAVRRGCQEASGTGRPEGILRDHVQPALREALEARGARSKARNELTIAVPTEQEAAVLDAPLASIGRADAVYNRFVIEFEPPGSLRPSVLHSATRHAVSQVQQYLRGIASHTGLPLERLAGCGFDGSWIVYVTWERGDWRIARPQRADTATLGALLDTLVSLAVGRGLTVENLEEDFGRQSDAAKRLVKALTALFLDGSVSGRASSMFEQWRVDLGNASGPFSPSDLAEWRTLCGELDVSPSEAASSHVLFSLQTYFALVAKLVGCVILEGATGQTLLPRLTRGNLWDGFGQLESGELTSSTNALNVVERGVFSWYLSDRTATVLESLETLVENIKDYSAEIVEITPLVARDLLKDLYQELLPRSIRHRLGEYYTPDWLAQRVINQVTGSNERLPSTKRILDPACGSGTFLIEVVSRMIATDMERSSSGLLERIIDNVVGFDLSPLAVQASKVNYLLALAPLLKQVDAPVFIPVFLADSVSPPRRGNLLEGDVYVVETSEGDWRIPASLAEGRFISVLGSVLKDALANQRGTDNLRQVLTERLPISEQQDASLLDQVDDLYQKTRDLEEADRNGMWWDLINNAFAPTVMGRFDYVVGNPPWVSWETLPERYRRANRDLWTDYKLRPDSPLGRRQSSENVALDLSMLFVSKCIDRYLAGTGTLGFVITASVFQTELAGRGFRRRHLPDSSAYRFVHIDDMSGLQIFEGASNQMAVLVADKKGLQRTPLPVVRWSAHGSRTIPPSAELEKASSLTRRRHLYGEPADPNDSASPLLVMSRPGLEASRSLRQMSPYLRVIRKGIDTRGANGIFFVEILDEAENQVLIRNLAREGRRGDVSPIEGWVERDSVKRLLRGANVRRGRAEPGAGLILFHDDEHVSTGMPPHIAKAKWPHAFEYISNFETLLKSRRRFRNFDPTEDGWLGIYSVTKAALVEHKVVVREIATGMIAAAVHDRSAIPDHKLYVIPCLTLVEADALAEVLNSPIVDYVIRAFSVSTSITGSFLRYVGIRDLSRVTGGEDRDQLLQEALGISADEVRILESIAQSELS
jgi:SAM-dependent methyltransferase